MCSPKKGFELMGMLYFISTFPHFHMSFHAAGRECVCVCIQSSPKKAQLLFPDAAESVSSLGLSGTGSMVTCSGKQPLLTEFLP